jgi:hypothetical protein
MQFELHRTFVCGDEWNRTIDTRIFSPLLYRLSYITFRFPVCTAVAVRAGCKYNRYNLTLTTTKTQKLLLVAWA